MIRKTAFSSYLKQQANRIEDHTNSLSNKIEVITDSEVIVNAIRVLILVLALLMGYIHTPKEKKEVSEADSLEITIHNKIPVSNEIRPFF